MNIYEQAYDTIVKIAEEEGVDVDDLSDEQVQELIEELVEEQAERGEGGEEVKEAHLTYADVARELSKIAHVNGIDITEVSAEEYNAAFDKLASDMSDPSYWESQQKVAEADYIGRVMAQSFYDESQKIAAKKQVAKGLMDRIRGVADSGTQAVNRGLRDLGGKVQKATGGRAGRKTTDRLAEQVESGRRSARMSEKRFLNTPQGQELQLQHDKHLRNIGALTLGGGTLAAGAGGYGAYKALKGGEEEAEKVSALDDLVTQRAVDLLETAGLI